MNKIIVNPNYCSREEYQELKDYLTDKTWDWQEVSSGEREIPEGHKITEILQHKIEYFHNDWDGEIDDCDIEHIQKMIQDRCNQGELNTGEEEHRGWWKIVK